jgi:hypothetical protein
MKKHTQQESPSDRTRRTILQAAGAAGFVGLGATTGSAKENKRIAEGVTFAEFGLSFEYSEDLDMNTHYDQLEFYHIDEGRLVFSAIEESNIEKFHEVDAVIRHRNLHRVPTQITHQKYSSVWNSLNKHYKPKEGFTIQEPIQVPAVRIEEENSEISVRSTKSEVKASPGDLEVFNLGTEKSRSKNNKSIQIEIKGILRNHGSLNVIAEHVVGGE